jgi:uncharacterized protein YlxP (DUF503 family)
VFSNSCGTFIKQKFLISLIELNVKDPLHKVEASLALKVIISVSQVEFMDVTSRIESSVKTSLL